MPFRRHFELVRKRYLLYILLTLLVTACVTTPVTERKALILIPFEQELALGAQAYREVLNKEKESGDERLKAIIRRVGRRIASVSDMPDLDWEFTLIESKEKNAFALPGGKVAFYEGILGVCENEAGVATVMGHEVAHAIARHGAQRLSQELIMTGVLTAAAIRLEDRNNKDLILAALGLGATVGITLPFSRMNEAEADYIGLIYMARAGYDPREAVNFWRRFNKLKKGKQIPEFLSTHPSDEKRIQEIERLLPLALKEYARAGHHYGLGERLLK